MRCPVSQLRAGRVARSTCRGAGFAHPAVSSAPTRRRPGARLRSTAREASRAQLRSEKKGGGRRPPPVASGTGCWEARAWFQGLGAVASTSFPAPAGNAGGPPQRAVYKAQSRRREGLGAPRRPGTSSLSGSRRAPPSGRPDPMRTPRPELRAWRNLDRNLEAALARQTGQCSGGMGAELEARAGALTSPPCAPHGSPRPLVRPPPPGYLVTAA